MILLSCNQKNEIKLTQTDPTEQKILNFKDKLKSTKKSSEMIEVDSAVWYIEAALNYSYCEPAITELLKTDSVFVSVPISETNEINFNDVIVAYNDLSNGMNTILGQIPDENKKIQLADVSIVKNNTKTNSENFKLIIRIVWYPRPIPFNDTDYWHPMWGAGKCDIYERQGIEIDAGILIAQQASYRIPYLEPGYLTDVETQEFWGGDYPDYLWYAVLNSSTDACLSPEEMEHWSDQLFALANNNTPQDKMIIAYEVGGEIILSPSPYPHMHRASISYGIWHYN
ncbi:MAG: hypothetical protein B6I20_05325 [Bacteroidetes bacterium 4572_117]|nr:MAG: hypothetical protein B6I20_05325 [Bacteroidetes bacterium 4572_117]